MNYCHFKTFAWGAVKKTHADSNILSRTTLNPSNDIVKRKIWIIPHSAKNIWIKEVFAGFYTFENTALSCALFSIVNNNKDKSYSFWERVILRKRWKNNWGWLWTVTQLNTEQTKIQRVTWNPGPTDYNSSAPWPLGHTAVKFENLNEED